MPANFVEVRDIPLDRLAPFPGNARRGDIEAIRGSLRRNGQYRALVVRETDDQLVILAGNHTYAALGAENYQAARCEIIHCDDETARRINLADNRTAELGGYDEEALAALLAELPDLNGTGYTDDDLEALLASATGPAQIHGDPDDAPPLEDDAITEPGQLWHLGPHRLQCGDATEAASVEALFAGELADCMWTDPPYGVEYVGKTKDALTISNDGAQVLPRLLATAFAVAAKVLRPGAPVYIAHADTARVTFETAMLEAGWSFRQNLIWDKGQMVLGHSDYHYQHEPILYGFTAAPVGAGRLGRGGDRWYGDNTQTTVFEVPKPPRNAEHPTMKPVELITRCLDNSCRPGGLVYEPFGGSGSTLIAAHMTGRIARVVELDPRYVDVICRRWQNATGQLPRLESGDERDFSVPL